MSVPPCLNLKTLAVSRRWRWRQAEEVTTRNQDPWGFEIPCHLGVISPYGHDDLLVYVEGHAPARRALAALPGIIGHQHGDREDVFRFHVNLLDEVAAIVQPRKLRPPPPPGVWQKALECARTHVQSRGADQGGHETEKTAPGTSERIGGV